MPVFCLNDDFRLQKTNRATRRWKQPLKKSFYHVSRDKILHSLGQGFLRPPFVTRRGPWERGWLGTGTSYARAMSILNIQMLILIHYTNPVTQNIAKQHLRKYHLQKSFSNNARSVAKGLPLKQKPVSRTFVRLCSFSFHRVAIN